MILFTGFYNRPPTIIGKAEPGSLVTASVQGKTYTAKTNGSGDYSLYISDSLLDKSIISITAKDASDNVSTPLSVEFKLDVRVPTAPTVASTPEILNSTMPTITGKAQPNSIVFVSVGQYIYSGKPII